MPRTEHWGRRSSGSHADPEAVATHAVALLTDEERWRSAQAGDPSYDATTGSRASSPVTVKCIVPDGRITGIGFELQAADARQLTRASVRLCRVISMRPWSSSSAYCSSAG
jgi:hypothetical protein